MKRILLALIMLTFALSITGCASISYKPSVSLGESPKTIKAKVKIDTFVDKSPTDDKDSKVGGVSATAPGTLAGNLDSEITDAVLSDFNNNQLFTETKKRIDSPDLILKGNINRFYGKAGINELGWITIPLDILWFFGLPIQTDEGMVDITMQLTKTDGTLVGEYNGKYEYLETFSMYNNPVLNVPSRLNKAFSEAIKQIREKILADEPRLTTVVK